MSHASKRRLSTEGLASYYVVAFKHSTLAMIGLHASLNEPSLGADSQASTALSSTSRTAAPRMFPLLRRLPSPALYHRHRRGRANEAANQLAPCRASNFAFLSFVAWSMHGFCPNDVRASTIEKFLETGFTGDVDVVLE
jgi:hypothetical protein